MKKLIFIIFYILSPSIYAEDAFDVIEKALVNKPIEESMQPWEKNLSKNEWKDILENCYDRNINQSAKALLLKILNKNGLNIGTSASARENDNSLNMYCSHALSLANTIGFKAAVIPLNSNDIPAINRASFIRYCYDFRKKALLRSLGSN